jgi:hypothetical protein
MLLMLRVFLMLAGVQKGRFGRQKGRVGLGRGVVGLIVGRVRGPRGMLCMQQWPTPM